MTGHELKRYALEFKLDEKRPFVTQDRTRISVETQHTGDHQIIGRFLGDYQGRVGPYQHSGAVGRVELKVRDTAEIHTAAQAMMKRYELAGRVNVVEIKGRRRERTKDNLDAILGDHESTDKKVQDLEVDEEVKRRGYK